MQWSKIEGCDVCGAERCAFQLQPDGTVRRLCTWHDLNRMLESYLHEALDLSHQWGDGNPLSDDCEPDDISDETWLASLTDCAAFLESEADDLDESGLEYGDIGAFFWLNRNRHGVGFWDRGLGELGDRLSKASKVYGTVDLYLGDDGKVYGS